MVCVATRVVVADLLVQCSPPFQLSGFVDDLGQPPPVDILAATKGLQCVDEACVVAPPLRVYLYGIDPDPCDPPKGDCVDKANPYPL